MLTVLEVIRKTSEFLATKAVESPRLNAELLVGHALGLPRMRLYLEFERPLTEAELASIRELVRRRARREPLQYITGHVDFHGLKLKADRRALIPRPETELLVETVVARVGAAPASILDLGTGSGAIALALAAAFPLASVTAVDASAEALGLAAENAASCGLAGRVTFLESSWFSALGEGSAYELIVANPPYLSEQEVASASPEVRDHEPRQALASGDSGIADLEAIVASAPRFLAPAGLLALETGVGHHARLAEATVRAGFARSDSLRDLAGRDRFVLAWRAG